MSVPGVEEKVEVETFTKKFFKIWQKKGGVLCVGLGGEGMLAGQ